MGTIKDLTDLITNLIERTKDAKMREALLPVKEKVLDLREDFIDQKAAHAKDMEEVKERHTKQIEGLQERIRQLRAENADLRSSIEKHEDKTAVLCKYRFDEHTRVYKNDEGRDFCPHCLHQDPPAEVPLGEPDFQWRCSRCGTTYNNPDYVSPGGPTVVRNTWGQHF
jgi:cell division protein FtsB